MNYSCDGSKVIPISILICMEMIFGQWGHKYNFLKLCLVWNDCPFFTFQLDSRQWTFHASLGGGQSKEFPITPHFYFMWFGKCCPPFTYIGGQKGKNFIFQNRTFYFGEPPQFPFFLSDGQIGSLQQKKNLGSISSNKQESLIGLCEIYLKRNKLVCTMIQSCCLLTMFAYKQGLYYKCKQNAQQMCKNPLY